MKHLSIYRNRAVRNLETGEIGTLITGSDQEAGDCKSCRVHVDLGDGAYWISNDLTDDDFDYEWEILEYGINKYNQTIHIGDILFMPIRPNKYFSKDESWVARVNDIGQFGVTLRYVNWKRKGGGTTYSFGLDDINLLRTDDERGLRKATKEEVDYFHKRTDGRYLNGEK